jgi:two-component system chemotaxis response regulator CheB
MMVNNDQNQGFAGTLKHIQLTDLIQMCCLSAATIGIRVSEDEHEGTIYIQDGRIVHAVCEDITGEEAFYRILGWKSGSFETLDGGQIQTESIDKSYQFLLMEAAHQADEQAHETIASDQELDLAADKCLKMLIVEDSPMMQKILTSMLNADPDIKVVGNAKNGEEALKMIEAHHPDIITMDVNMPVMNGSTALKHIMIKNPCPVVIMSNVGPGSHQKIIDFLNLGAVDFMSKPVKHKDILIQQQKIVERVHQSAHANMKAFKRINAPKQAKPVKASTAANEVCRKLVIIATGAGGHSELLRILSELPENLRAGLIVQHTVPPLMIPALAEYLDRRSKLPVEPIEGKGGVSLSDGCCYFSTSGYLLTVETQGEKFCLYQDTEPKTDPDSPEVFDLFLTSVAAAFKENVAVVLLSGARAGHLEGLKQVKEMGGRIVVQDTKAAVVATPLERVLDSDLVDQQVASEEIVNSIVAFTKL